MKKKEETINGNSCRDFLSSFFLLLILFTANTSCSIMQTTQPGEKETPIQTINEITTSEDDSASIGPSMTSEKDGMILLYVPDGEFTRGSLDSDPVADSDETPQEGIYLDAFWIDQTEVTNSMFAQFLNEMGNLEEGGAFWFDSIATDVHVSQSDGNWQVEGGYEDYPVVEVSWYGAWAYCQWAGRVLPTEAQWEKAARGADGNTYPWGEGINCELTNYRECEEFPNLSPVGYYPTGASPYGALDMAGNVWEWVVDWYGSDYFNTAPKNNPSGPESGDYRIMRGGSWQDNEKITRSTTRNYNIPRNSVSNLGFRCALQSDF